MQEIIVAVCRFSTTFASIDGREFSRSRCGRSSIFLSFSPEPLIFRRPRLEGLHVHAIDWIVVFAYLDETGTHDSATESVVAAYVFSKDGAKLFRRMGQENMYPLLPPDKHGIRMYHSTTNCRMIWSGQIAALASTWRAEQRDDSSLQC
jgi:hypothetical protein